MIFMSIRIGLTFPLWTHRDAAGLLEQAAGEIGIDHVVVPVVTGPLAVLRNPAWCTPPAFQTEGGWHFPPDLKRYTACGVRPHAARWMAQRDQLSQLAQIAVRLSIRIVVRMEPAAAVSAVDHHESLLMRDPWSEPFTSHAGCLCNPAVRELALASIQDAERAAVEQIELLRDIPSCSTARCLQACGLAEACFCGACRQLAEREGVDAEAAMLEARQRMERMFHAAAANAVEPREPDAPLDRWLRSRVVDLERWSSGLRRDGRPVVEDAASARRRGELFELVLNVRSADSASELVRSASGAVERGARRIVFCDLDTAPQAALTWAKQAARFARRSAL